MRTSEELGRNLAQVVLRVRDGRADSRRMLSEILRLSPSTVGAYVDQLIASGHLLESGLQQGPMGRPKRVLATVPDAGWFCGIEFNAERIQGACVDFSGKLRQSLSRPLAEEATVTAVLEEIASLIRDLRSGAAGRLLAIGVGAPGVVNPATGLAMHYSFLPGWRNVRVRSEFTRRFRVPVIVENNLRVIALAERWFGSGRELDDYVILGPRSGFGIAVMKQGRLLDGAHHAAGEVGRWAWPLTEGGGEMHDALSSPAVWRRLAGVTSRARLPADLHAALERFAKDGGAEWRGVVDDYARVLGLLQLLLDSPAYFLHGPLTALGGRFCAAISRRTAELTPALRERPPRIVPSGLGDDAGALGAAGFAMEAWIPG
jgi:predicted NBD/HSP70 family sugar kinase